MALTGHESKADPFADLWVYHSLNKAPNAAPYALAAVAIIWIAWPNWMLVLIFGGFLLLVSAAIASPAIPPNSPLLKISDDELRFCKNLSQAYKLQDVRRALGSPGTSKSAPSLLLDLERRIENGQRYYDRTQIPLGHVQAEPDDIANNINERLQRVKAQTSERQNESHGH